MMIIFCLSEWWFAWCWIKSRWVLFEISIYKSYINLQQQQIKPNLCFVGCKMYSNSSNQQTKKKPTKNFLRTFMIFVICNKYSKTRNKYKSYFINIMILRVVWLVIIRNSGFTSFFLFFFLIVKIWK